MIWLKNIRVWTLEIDAIRVAWDVVDTTEDLAGYTVSVWRSEALVGPYHQVSGELLASTYDEFRDSSVNRLVQRRPHIYRLRVLKTSDDSVLFFGSADTKAVLDGADPLGVPLEAVPEILAAESVRRFELVAREKAGRKALHLRRRTVGQYCPACWDRLANRARVSGCQVCWGTHRAGGYYTPQVFWPVEQPPAEDQAILTTLFEIEQNDRVVRASALARIGLRDLIIYATGERWTVQGVKENHRGGSVTWQWVHMRSVPPKDIEHRLPVSWDIDSLRAGPVRAYVHATDIESFRAAAQDRGLESETMGTREFPTTPLLESG